MTLDQVAKLRSVLADRGFKFEEKPYTLYAATKEKLHIAVYEKGPKALLQGRGLEDFITFVLEPEVLGEARLGYEEVLDPEQFSPTSGSTKAARGICSGRLLWPGFMSTPIWRNTSGMRGSATARESERTKRSGNWPR